MFFGSLPALTRLEKYTNFFQRASTMSVAAREGEIEALYGLSWEKSDVLREIDQMEFVDILLHIAAAAGCTEFATELMDLKPSFTMKLNQDGLSAIHLALLNGQSDTVPLTPHIGQKSCLCQGKNGYTPLQYVVMKGDRPVLAKFLEDCPNCIHDVTNRNETALHLAAKNNNLKAFEVLLPWLWISNHSRSQVKKEFSTSRTGMATMCCTL
ncbi:hypothetical protein CRYUN_Cryun09bG0092900 [Craigia yunnanensis]